MAGVTARQCKAARESDGDPHARAEGRSYTGLGRLLVQQRRYEEAQRLYEEGSRMTEGSSAHIWQARPRSPAQCLAAQRSAAQPGVQPLQHCCSGEERQLYEDGSRMTEDSNA